MRFFLGSDAAPLDALRRVLQDVDVRRAPVQVVLGSEWVRYALVPDADALRNDVERRAAARHALTATFGELVRGWDVANDRGAVFSTMLAAAISEDLRQGIESTLREAGAASVSLQPSLANAVNVAALPRDGWLVLTEGARLVLLTLRDGEIAAVRSQRLRISSEKDLDVLRDQSRLLDGATGETVLFDAEQAGRRRRDMLVEFGQHAPRLRGSEVAWLAAGIAAVAIAGWHYGGLASDRTNLQRMVADAERFGRRQVQAPISRRPQDARALAGEVARANTIAARLSVPWVDLLTDLETAAGGHVTLVGLEPDGNLRRLRITGEARRFEDVTQYLRRLEGARSLQNVFLTAHETRERGGVAFTLTTDWIRNEPPRP